MNPAVWVDILLFVASSLFLARSPPGRRSSLIIYGLALIAVAHSTAAMTYETWAAALFSTE